MKRILLLFIALLLSGCTAPVTYYNPTGPGKLYGNCNTPLNILRFIVSDEVYFSIRAYPGNDKLGIQLSGSIEVPDGFVAQLTSSEFKFVSLSGKERVSESLKEFSSRYAKRDVTGKVISVKEMKVNALDTLTGATHRDSGFWGSIYGNYSQQFDYAMFVNGFSENSFLVSPPDILINGKRYTISPIEFNLITKSIFLSPCP